MHNGVIPANVRRMVWCSDDAASVPKPTHGRKRPILHTDILWYHDEIHPGMFSDHNLFFADYLYSCESVPATRFHAEHLTQGRMAVETSKPASTSQFSKSRCCKISLRKIDTRPTCRRNQKTTATLHVCVCGHTVGVRPHVHNCCSSYILIATRYFILTTQTPRMSLVVVALNGRAVPKQPFMFWLLRNPPDRPPVAQCRRTGETMSGLTRERLIAVLSQHEQSNGDNVNLNDDPPRPQKEGAEAYFQRRCH